ncbi:hypothetical protein ES703_57468 [subsurface metagenome]
MVVTLKSKVVISLTPATNPDRWASARDMPFISALNPSYGVVFGISIFYPLALFSLFAHRILDCLCDKASHRFRYTIAK